MFCFHLAEKLGKTVKELLLSLDAQELAEWQIYLNLDHWKKHIAEKTMTEKERADALKRELFRGVKVKHEYANQP